MRRSSPTRPLKVCSQHVPVGVERVAKGSPHLRSGLGYQVRHHDHAQDHLSHRGHVRPSTSYQLVRGPHDLRVAAIRIVTSRSCCGRWGGWG